MELKRAKRLVAAAADVGSVRRVAYNSAGGRGARHVSSQARQKHAVEDVLMAAGLPHVTALQAALFMEVLLFCNGHITLMHAEYAAWSHGLAASRVHVARC